VDIVHLVDLDHVFEKHENHVAEEARLPAERRLGREKVKNPLHETFEVLLVLEDLPRLQLLTSAEIFFITFVRMSVLTATFR